MNEERLAPPHSSPIIPRSSLLLKPGRVEGVAAAHVAAVEALPEPARALLRGAVREGVGHGVALLLLLQTVVAYRGGRAQGLFEVAGVEYVALLRVVAPDARVAVGLKLQHH